MNVLLDLDGTLTDPGEGFVKCVEYALSKLGCPAFTHAEIRKHIGPPLEDTLGRLLEGDGPRVKAAVALYRERYASEGYLENMVYPGIPETLHALRGKEARLYVATSKPSVFAERILVHFGLQHHFQGIYGSELDGTRSNKAELISYLLKRESIAAHETVMIGDRAHDIAGALANAVHPIGALWGYGSRDELADAGAKLLCEHPLQLPEVLSRS